jgi:hypothetical protein
MGIVSITVAILLPVYFPPFAKMEIGELPCKAIPLCRMAFSYL